MEVKLMAKKNSLKQAAAALRKRALAYPKAIEDFPWGHTTFKVNKKAFLFTYLHEEDEPFLSLSFKLPESGKMALTLPFASPTQYGLGKSGWVTCRFHAKDDIPLDMLKEWTAESFRDRSEKDRRAPGGCRKQADA